MKNPFCYLLRVRYYECDAQNVVFNARYGDYIDTASTEYFRALMGDYRNLLKRGLDCQVVKQTTEWQAPARFDDVLSIYVRTAHIGNTSFSFEFTLINYDTKQTVATSEVVYVLVDADTFKKTVIPDDVKQQFLAGAPDTIINHAGV